MFYVLLYSTCFVLVVGFCGDPCIGKVKATGEVPVHVVQAYGGMGIQLHTFLTSASDTGEWSDVHPGRYLQSERHPCLLVLSFVTHPVI